jgi:hypothetical protein
MTGNFSPENSAVNLPPNRTTCTVEHSGQLSEEEMRLEVMGLPFDMQPVAYNYCENSYGHLEKYLSREFVLKLGPMRE